MTRRSTAFILTCITVLAAVVPLSACAPQPVESAQTQEEFQAEYLKKMERMLLYIPPDVDPDLRAKFERTLIADGVEILENDLRLSLHVYELDSREENVPTAKEVIGLYFTYDDIMYERFNKFYEWYMNYGDHTCQDYKDALRQAYYYYHEKNGAYFRDTDWSDYTLEDLFELEAYVKENPDYSIKESSYNQLLKWLGVKK